MKLSPSSLGMFKDCPKCFWLEKVGGVKKPKGIFPSLPGGMDRILKNWYDSHRQGGFLPHEIQGQIEGSLYKNEADLKKWRNWRSGLSCTVEGMELGGAIDDLFVETNEMVSPFDYKTRGSAPKPDAPDYYGHQMDAYALLLEKNGFKLSGKAYLAYYFPAGVDVDVSNSPDTSCRPIFTCQIENKTVDPKRTIAMMKAATACLKGDMPAQNPDCEFCSYAVAMVAK